MANNTPRNDSAVSSTSVGFGLASLVSALAALYFFGSHELWSRTLGLTLTLVSGGLAWLVHRLRGQARNVPATARAGCLILLIFALCGVAGFFLPEEGRWRLAWFFVVFLRRVRG